MEYVIIGIDKDLKCHGIFSFYSQEKFHSGQFNVVASAYNSNYINSVKWDDDVVSDLQDFQSTQLASVADGRLKDALIKYSESKDCTRAEKWRAKKVIARLDDRKYN